jgi:hypothetical protein
LLGQAEAEIVVAQSELSLGGNPVRPLIVDLEVEYFLVMGSYFGVLCEVEVDYHQQVVDIGMGGVHCEQGLDLFAEVG